MDRLLNGLTGRPSALVIPVPGVVDAVRAWRGDGHVTSPGDLPLHVTVLWPFVRARRLGSATRQKLGAIAAASAPFAYTLTGVARFPGVLHLAVEPHGAFLDLTAAVHARWPHHPPYAGAHRTVVPHVTVATGELAERTDVAALEAVLPMPAVAQEMLLAVQDRTDAWAIVARYPLGAATSR